jgi:hypothetical protein
VAPLRLGGLRGRRVPLALDGRYREVTSVSKRELDGACIDNDSSGHLGLWYTHAFILNGRLILFLRFHLLYFYCVKIKVFYLAFLIENLKSS